MVPSEGMEGIDVVSIPFPFQSLICEKEKKKKYEKNDKQYFEKFGRIDFHCNRYLCIDDSMKTIRRLFILI